MQMCECGNPRGDSVYRKCMECIYATRKQKLLEKIQQPPEMCEIHNVLKVRNNCGSQICKQCTKEQSKRRAADKISSGKPPLPCNSCGGARIWNTFGQAVCTKCKGDYLKEWSKPHKEQLKEYRHEHYENNKEKYAIQNRQYQEQNKEAIRKQKQEYMNRFDPEFWVWRTMNARCHNPNIQNYKDYGGRGIEVYEDWRYRKEDSKESNFEKYLAFKKYLDDHLGPKPTDYHSIDRINNHRGYEPDNLKWSTREEQANNKRSSLALKRSIPDDSPMYDLNGNLITLKEFAEQIKLPLSVAKYRYVQNCSPKWIMGDDYDNRYYEHDGHKYNIPEITIWSGLKYSTVWSRLVNLNWTVAEVLSRNVRGT